MAANEIYRSKTLYSALEKHAGFLFTVSSLIFLAMLGLTEWAVPKNFSSTIWAISVFGLTSACLLISSIGLKGRVRDLLASQPLHHIAVLSYAIYLAHFPMVGFAANLASLEKSFSIMRVLIFLCVYVILTMVYALLLHYLIERPFLRWKDRLK